MSSNNNLKPLGVFWDTNNCFMPLIFDTNQFINHLREFIANKFQNNCIEYEFNCISETTQLNDSIIKSLKQNGCTVLHIEDNTEINVFIKFEEIVERFVQNYGFDSIVVLISSNCQLSSTIRRVQHRDVSLLLIYGQNSDKTLIDSAYHSVAFDDVFHLNETVILTVYNLPNAKSMATIQNSFLPFCRQFNCEFRFNTEDSVKFVFNHLNDAKRAELFLNEFEFNDLFTDVDQNDNQSISSAKSSLVSPPSSPQQKSLPQNDDKCKSVLIGLSTKYNQNVFKLVRNLVNSWNDSSVNESMILRVNRERDFIGRDGKASLIVTAIDRQSNTKLISAAKKMFVNREQKIYWNRLQRSKKDSNDSPVYCPLIKENTFDSKSIITGLWTKSDDNVLKIVKNLVKSWDIYSFDIRNIVCVERAKRFTGRDGKAALIVTTDSSENCKRLLSLASVKFNDNNRKYYWKAFQKESTFGSNETIESEDRRSQQKTDTSGSYADIVSKPITQEKRGNRCEKQNNITVIGQIYQTNNKCNCQ